MNADNAVIVGGKKNVVTESEATIVGGQQNIASGNKASIVGGQGNIASGNYAAIVGGKDNKAIGDYTFAFGNKSTANGENSVAGLGGTTDKSASNAIAIGKSASVTTSNSIAMGTSATASGDNTVAIGNGATASLESGVAIGNGSVSSTKAGVAGYDLSTDAASTETTSAWVSNAAAFAVGNGSTLTRQITGVAAGFEDTDAVNVAQLKKAVSAAGGSVSVSGDNLNLTETTVNGKTNYDISLKEDIKVNSVTINNGLTVNSDGIDMNNKKITNVADGTANSDAVNYGQLKQVQQATQDVAHDLSKLSNRVDKGIAGAAALAALHPMDFDPDDKLTFAAGLGNYKGENAGAVGMFFRPDEKVMLSLGATVGNSENIVNAGVSFSLDRTARNTNNKAAMAREILDMRAQMNQMASANAALVQQVNEMAAIINELKGNNALKPLAAENAIAGQEEARIRVEHIDTVDGYKLDEAHQIDRVHVVGDTKDENGNVIVKRDHYGNVVSQESK